MNDMNKFCHHFLFSFLVILPFCSIQSFAQKVIQMERDGGVYKIPCTVNGAKLKMIFDTGASTVCLSLATAVFLYQNDYISKSDFKGTGYSSTASGDIVDHMKINLRDIEIGGMHLYNVEGVVMESLTAPLLLGQSAIQKLGSITIKGDQLIINNGYSSSKSNFYRGNYFNFNGYKIDTDALIQALRMNFADFPGFMSHSANRKQHQAAEVNTIIGFIQKGDCYFELNSMYFINSASYYGSMKRSKKEYSYVTEAVYYVEQIAKGFVQRGDYIR